jgi:hypothetical protein
MADQRPEILIYAAKFLCGVFDPEHAGDQEYLEGPVRPWAYTTAINVHNPNPRRPATFRKKAVLLFEGSKPVLQEELERPVAPGDPSARSCHPIGRWRSTVRTSGGACWVGQTPRPSSRAWWSSRRHPTRC